MAFFSFHTANYICNPTIRQEEARDFHCIYGNTFGYILPAAGRALIAFVAKILKIAVAAFPDLLYNINNLVKPDIITDPVFI